MRNTLVILGFFVCLLLILWSAQAHHTDTQSMKKPYKSIQPQQDVLTEEIDHELYDVLLRVEHEVSKTWDESDALRYKLTAPVQSQEPLDLNRAAK
jgi:hypothetical protein